MPLDHKYRHIEVTQAGVEIDVTFIPAGDGKPASWTETVVPAGAIRVMNLDNLENLSYGDLPVGLPETPEWQIEVDLSLLTGGTDTDMDTVTDLEDMAIYIIQNGFTDGGEITLGSYTRQFTTRNIWILRARLLLPGQAQETCIIAEQRVDESMPLKHDPVSGESKITIRLWSIARSMMERITAVDIQRFVEEHLDVAPAMAGSDFQAMPDDRDGALHTFELIWEDSADRIIGRAIALIGEIEQITRYYKLHEFWIALEHLCMQVYASMMRYDPAGAVVGGNLVRFKSPLQRSSMGNPFDLLTFHERAYDNANARGAALDRTALYMPLMIYEDVHDSFTNVIGGFLRPESEDQSIHHYENLWEYMKRCTSHCRVQLQHGVSLGQDILNIRFDYVDSWTSLELKPEDLLAPVSAGTAVDLVIGANVISRATWSLVGGYGDDLKGDELVIQDGATETGKSAPFEWAHHTNPTGYSESNVKIGPRFLDGVPGTHYYITSPALDCTGIYYFDQPTFADKTIPIKCHTDVGLKISPTKTVYYGSDTVLPDVYMTSGEIEYPDPSKNYHLLRGAIIEMQRQQGIGWVTAFGIGKFFSGPHQWTLERHVDLSREVYPNHHGRTVLLTTSGGSPATGNIILQVGTYLGVLNGKGVIHSASYAFSGNAEGTAKLKLFFPDSQLP